MIHHRGQSSVEAHLLNMLGYDSNHFVSFAQRLLRRRAIGTAGLKVPANPLSFQLVSSSYGPMNSSHSRRASAPYFSIIASGVTTLPLLLDIRRPSGAHRTPWLRKTGKGS